MSSDRIETRWTREAVEEEALTHIDALYRTAFRMTRSPEDAEDLVQDAYLRAFRSLDRFTPGTNLRAWLFKIMTNAFINDYRKRSRQPRSSSMNDMEDYYLYSHLLDSGIQPTSPQPEVEALDRIADEEILEALDSLPPDFRQVVLLADVEGFAYREIADIVGIPIGTVMSRLHRARRRLRQLLVVTPGESFRIVGDGHEES